MEEKLFSNYHKLSKKEKGTFLKTPMLLSYLGKVKSKIANKLEEAVETVTAYLYEGKKELPEESLTLSSFIGFIRRLRFNN